MSLTGSRKIGLFLTLLLVATLTLWGFVIEPGFRHHVERYDITVKDWKLEGYRIAVLADLHTGSPFNGISKLEEIVRLTNETNPDLTLIAGDIVIQGVIGGSFVTPNEITQTLGKLKAKDGVFAVLGNHDHWHSADQITKAFQNSNIEVLTNRAVKINGFWLLGVDDFWAGAPDLVGALEKVDDQKSIVLFTHNPDLFVDVPEKISLSIAGHTHGGQVYIPLIGRPIVPSAYGERFVIGHIRENGKQMFVSPGTGTSILPVRFLVPPEISLIQLNGEKR